MVIRMGREMEWNLTKEAKEKKEEKKQSQPCQKKTKAGSRR